MKGLTLEDVCCNVIEVCNLTWKCTDLHLQHVLEVVHDQNPIQAGSTSRQCEALDGDRHGSSKMDGLYLVLGTSLVQTLYKPFNSMCRGSVFQVYKTLYIVLH